jgi:hypothetical protein
MAWHLRSRLVRTGVNASRRDCPSRRARPRLEALEERRLLATVTNLNDSGGGSLRQAILDTPNFGTVGFASGLSGTITLNSGNLPIGKNLSILGPGADVITINGNSAFQIFNIAGNNTVNLSGLTLDRGSSNFTGFPNTFGGAVFNAGTLNITNSVISNSSANGNAVSNGLGGGIYNIGSLKLTNVLVSGNRALLGGGKPGSGGGIYNGPASFGLTLVNVTVANNTSDLGGGIADDKSAMAMTNCTVVGNSAGTNGTGGGIAISAVASVNLKNVLVAKNSAGTAPDVSGTVNAADHDLVGDGTGSTGISNGVNGNLVGTTGNPIDPRLGLLQNNGGPTFTMALLSNSNFTSPAIDAGTNTGAPFTDQRGFNRPVNNVTDIGAYEFQPPPTVTTLTIGSTTFFAGQQVTFTAAVSAIAPNSNSIPTGTSGTVSFIEGTTALGTVNLANDHTASFTTSFTAGSHAVFAVYNGFNLGDYHFAPSASPTLGLTATVVGPLLLDAGSPGLVQLRPLVNCTVSVGSFFPFGTGFAGSIAVAVGDINKDGKPDFVVAAREGNPNVKVYNGAAVQNGTFTANPDASLLAQFFPYALNFNVGANVAVGDVNGDGFPDLVTGASAGNPDVRVYSGKDIAQGTFNPTGKSLLAQWFPYALQFNVGANVAVGDLSHNGFADVITGATVGNPDVRVYSGKDIAQGTFNPTGSSLLDQFFGYGLNFNVGAFLATGDVNGDGFVDLLTGASAGNPDVRVYDGKAFANGTFNGQNPTASQLTQFFAYQLQFNIGVTLATGDADGDGVKDIITGTSAGSPHLRIVKGNATGTQPPAICETFGNPIGGGIMVGA